MNGAVTVARISYIRECRAFVAYAADNQLSANEFVLWHAFLNLFNAAANGNVWPDGFISVSNNKVLSLTTFRGSKRDETLRLTRDRLVSRGLIEYKKGSRNTANPQYKMVYFAPALPDDMADDDFTPIKRGNIRGNIGGNIRGNTRGNIGDIYTDYNQDTALDPNPVDSKHNENDTGIALTARARGKNLWYDPETPDAECDTAYLQSEAARASIAQRILDYCVQNGMKSNSANIHRLINDCLKRGIHPRIIQASAAGATTTREYATKLFDTARINGTPLYTDRASQFDRMQEYGLLSATGE